MTQFSIIRWNNYVTYVLDSPGITWNTGVSLITKLTKKSAISYSVSTWGTNYPAWSVDGSRVGIRYRRNFYRPWLFFELSPEVVWGKEDRLDSPDFGAMATLEVQFGK
jgi:hypothetical protein